MVTFFPQTRPVVGISGANADSASVRAMMTQIAAQGATPVFLGNHARRDAAKDIDKIDSLVVMGNNADLDPATYGQQRHPATNVETDTPEGKARAAYETAMLTMARDRKMPILGICGGFQRINVMQGGDLYQDIESMLGTKEHDQSKAGIAPYIGVIPVSIDKNSRLGSIGGNLLSQYVPFHRHYNYTENSMHHQAVRRVGNGLIAVAHAADKMPDGSQLVEAIEADPNGPYKDQFIVGVQWHPEFSASTLGAKIAKRLVYEAGQYASKNNTRHAPSEAARENILSSLDRMKDPASVQVRPGSMTEMILQQRAQQGQIALS